MIRLLSLNCQKFFICRSFIAFNLFKTKEESVSGSEIDNIIHFQETMSLNHNIESYDHISKMQKLSEKIMSYELNIRKHNSSLSSLLEETHEHRQEGQKQNIDMSQTLALFRKYLYDKARQARELTNAEEIAAEAANIQAKPCRSLLPPRDASLYSRPTLLEKELLPGLRQSLTLASNTSSPTGQLTIFYSGAVNVYDNVTADKAQAIMLLAGESSSSDPISPSTPTSTDTPKHSNFPGTKLQAELPIARKVSLRRFLDRRRDRISTSSPYSTGNLKQNAEKSAIYYG